MTNFNMNSNSPSNKRVSRGAIGRQDKSGKSGSNAIGQRNKSVVVETVVVEVVLDIMTRW